MMYEEMVAKRSAAEAAGKVVVAASIAAAVLEAKYMSFFLRFMEVQRWRRRRILLLSAWSSRRTEMKLQMLADMQAALVMLQVSLPMPVGMMSLRRLEVFAALVILEALLQRLKGIQVAQGRKKVQLPMLADMQAASVMMEVPPPMPVGMRAALGVLEV